ncbi:helix-turn-helix transcriptional regulator [Marinilactibacillus sp. Marseille-P9653]|uniref:ArsR/SmtB family transcription factor n=1 Tax=Marinilactibacillus sp. Marseille-P9653 TaxID=2866583 RepID=UPI001CE3E849|nr:metalloregulator ArsR/SmtB family transcription factor [Marinilactibacillus sp. Marseille-P9653]
MYTSSTLPFKNESLQEVSKLFKIISDPTRLSILFLLHKEELSVGSIAQSMSMEQSAISHQLKILKTSRLVKAKRVGKNMIYSLDDLHVFSILEQVLTHIEEQEK